MNFDRVAPHYRWLETLVFGDQLQQARIAFVREIDPPRRVLIVGEGDGRFLVDFVRAHPGAVVDCIEASERMIELGRARIAKGGTNFIHADVRDISLKAGWYDLIVTHFFLDCFADTALGDVVQKLARAGTADACWLLADFRVPPNGWQNFHAELSIRAMYRFFRLTSGLETKRLDDPSCFLKDAWFKCLGQRLARFGMIKSELWRRPP